MTIYQSQSKIMLISVMVAVFLLILSMVSSAESSGYYAFIPNSQDGTISVYDSTEQDIITSIKIGESAAHGVATTPDGRYLYTGVMGGEEIIVLDPLESVEQGTKVEVTTIDIEPPLHGIDIDPNGKYVIIGQTPQVIDTEQNEVVATIDMPEELALLAHPRFAPDGKRVYLGARPDNGGGFSSPETSVIVVSLDDFSIEDRWPLRGAYTSMPSRDGQYLYVVTYLAQATLTVLDADSGVLLKQAPAGKNSHGVAVSPDNRYVWVVSRGDIRGNEGNGVFIFDTENDWELHQRIELTRPNHIAFSPDGKEVLVTDMEENILVIYDAGTFAELRRVKTGPEPHEIAFIEK